MATWKSDSRQLTVEAADLEAIDGVGIADVVLHKACLVSRDATRLRNQFDASPS